jgi:hypothetical protein
MDSQLGRSKMNRKWNGVDYFVELGSCPDEERMAHIGSDLQRQQASIWKDQLERTFGPPPADARYRIKSALHYGGLYYELYLMYNENDDMSNDYAVDVQDNLPVNWDEQALQRLEAYEEAETESFVESIETDAMITWNDLASVIPEEAMPTGTDLGTALQQQPVADKASDIASAQATQAKLDKKDEERKAAEEKKLKQAVDPIRTKIRKEFDDLQNDTEKVGDALEHNTDISHGLTNLNQDLQNLLGLFKA